MFRPSLCHPFLVSLTQEELIATLQNEVRILLHLAGKVGPGMEDYRPTPGQRSTLELLRYLTFMGPELFESVLAGRFLTEEWTRAEEAAAKQDLAAVLANLDTLSGFYAEKIRGMTEAQLREPVEMFGQTASRGRFLVDFILCGHAAYRTQLFCYLKACGREELSTMNLWAGMDAA